MSHFVLKKIVCQKSNQEAFHPGPVLPPIGEGSPIPVAANLSRLKLIAAVFISVREKTIKIEKKNSKLI